MKTNNSPLPSTIDDIKSDRSTTLSPVINHQNIRALIGVAKSGSNDKITIQQNRVKINNEPLSNRRVMVPVTSKAL